MSHNLSIVLKGGLKEQWEVGQWSTSEGKCLNLSLSFLAKP